MVKFKVGDIVKTYKGRIIKVLSDCAENHRGLHGELLYDFEEHKAGMIITSWSTDGMTLYEEADKNNDLEIW